MVRHVLNLSQQNLDSSCFCKHHRHPKYQKRKVVVNYLITVGQLASIFLNSSDINMKKKWFEPGMIISYQNTL